MKWTPEQVKQLTNACMIGISNADMAKFFGVSVQEIHAKRSALGITIPKVKELREAREARRSFVNREFESLFKPLPPKETEKPRINPETLKKLADVCDTAGISLDTAIRWVALMVRLLADEKADRAARVTT